jgi:peptidoglycan/LPS O-acetylase OafA/YrhL
MATGKNLNDLGDFDMCRTTPGLKYGLISVYVGGYTQMHLGLCVPQECQKEELQLLVDGLVQSSGGLFTSGQFHFSEEETVQMSAGRALGITFFTLFFALCLAGAVIEYTPIFNKAQAQSGENVDPAKNKNLLGKALISFSPSRNLKKLFYSPFNSEDNLKVFNGVRLFSMFYVVLGHAYFNVLINPTQNPTYTHEFIQPLWFQIVPGGFFAVDVFFYLSGFLGVYLMICKFHGKKNMNFLMIYFHRFYRLAPNVLMLLLFAMTFYQYFGDGPYWFMYSQFWVKDCGKYWWTFVTFINSIYPGSNVACLGWLWYLSHDMIFFILLPFQVYAYIHKRIAGYALATLILVVNLIVVISITVKYNIASSVLVDPNYGDKIYFKPWSRAGAYQVGVILGMMYYEFVQGDKPEGNKTTLGYKLYKMVNLSAVIRWACYILGLGMILFTVFVVTPETRLMGVMDENGKQKRYFSPAFNAFYNSFGRPMYVFGLGLILTGPLVGKGSFLQVFLGSRFYAPWAKLSFYCYMIHLFIFTLFFGQARTAIYLSHVSVMWVYFSVIALTMMFSVPFSVLFEAPWMQLERLVLFPPKAKPAKEEKEYVDKLGDMKINNSDLDSTLRSETDVRSFRKKSEHS